jgi:1-acyl-sn-glycerol-3-phosphate acyltransferase
MVRNLTALLRTIRFSLHLFYGLILAIIYPRLGQERRQRILQNWSAGLLRTLGIRLTIPENGILHPPRHGMVVANHVSWLDIFVLNAVAPMRFVAKSEVRNWPVIGWLCLRAGTLFIERGKARDAARLNRQLAELLAQGECAAVFPEGTTTDGDTVNHFHSSLLQPAIDAACMVYPIALRYLDQQGRTNRAAAYINDVSFVGSLWQILTADSIMANVTTCLPIDAYNIERRSLAQTARNEIASALRGIPHTFEHDAVTDLSYSINACATSGIYPSPINPIGERQC